MTTASQSHGQGPQPDVDEIRRALRLFIREPGQVTEVRCILKGKGIASGYFNDVGKAAEAAATIRDAKGIYFTPNPVKLELLARASNRMRSRYESKPTTSDADILKRRWLLIDFDPERPAEISASDAEHVAALDRARQVRDLLTTNHGFPAPILADSGNGAHLVYAIELENDDQDGVLAKRVLVALDHLFTDERVKVDLVTHNAARIWKLYGTISRKGDDIPERPHRVSRILEVPEVLACIPRALLESLASIVPEPKTWRGREGLGSVRDVEAWLLDWIRTHSVPVIEDEPQTIAGGKKLWKLRQCPWNSEHGSGDAWIVLHPGGVIGARCWHNGCAGKGWRELREQFEPGCYESRQRSKSRTEEPSSDRATGGDSAPPDLSVLEGLIERVRDNPNALDADGVLEALGYLCATQPGEYEGIARDLRKAGVRLKSFEPRVLAYAKKYRVPPGGQGADSVHREVEWRSACGKYFLQSGCFYRLKTVKVEFGGTIEVPVLLSSFHARVTEDLTRDDGLEEKKTFALEGALASKRPLPHREVPSSQFDGLAWIPSTWGVEPAVLPAQTDHVAYAIRLYSGDVPRRTIFTHLGFRRVESGLVYLHAAGAIGAKNIEVDVARDGLQRYALPDSAEDARGAMRVSLDFLSSGLPQVVYPAWALPWRAALCEFLRCTVMPHWVGGSGKLKSSLAAAILAHHGDFRTKEDLPGRWEFTDNILEKGSFLAKDVLFVIDDLNPESTRIRKEELERRFSRIAASVGNLTGRRRMGSNLATRLEYFPRGLVLSTGEYTANLPSSRLARIFPIPFDEGAVDPEKLGELQKKLHVLPHVMRAFIEHLRSQDESFRERLKEKFERYREDALELRGLHSRLPENVSHLYLGFELGMTFAVTLDAIEKTLAQAHIARAWEIFCTLAREHGRVIGEERPVAAFLGTIEEALAQGRAWLADPSTGLLASGDAGVGSEKLGWADGEGIYLLPAAAYKFASGRLEYRGGVQVSERALHKLLEEDRKLLRSESEPDRLTPNKWCEDTTHRVLWLRRDSISLPPPKSHETHCYRCKEELSADTNERCPKCRWLRCYCGACGCRNPAGVGR
jgi:hypothetical protein